MLNQSGQQIAVVANQIIQSRHRLDPMQQKVIAWAIGQIARDDTDFMVHKLSVAEFGLLIGSVSGNLYAQLEAVTTSLLRTVLEIKLQEGDRSRTKFQWLSRCKYRDGEGSVELRFHEELKPYLLELKRCFTQLRLEKLYKFRSAYTIRFYEKLEMQRGLNRLTWAMSLADLKDWLGLEQDAYDGFSALKAYILDVAQRELDIKSDFSFDYTPKKEGRKIVAVNFTQRPSRRPKIEPGRDLWKKAKPSIKAKLFSAARDLPRFEDLSEADMLKDSAFWAHLPVLFDKFASDA